MAPLYDFCCAAGHTSERRVLQGVATVECDCGLPAGRAPVFGFSTRTAVVSEAVREREPVTKGVPIKHYHEAAQEAQYRHDKTDDPVARAQTRPDVWKPALQRARVRIYDRAFGVDRDTHWNDPRPKLSDRERRDEVA